MTLSIEDFIVNVVYEECDKADLPRSTAKELTEEIMGLYRQHKLSKASTILDHLRNKIRFKKNKGAKK